MWQYTVPTRCHLSHLEIDGGAAGLLLSQVGSWGRLKIRQYRTKGDPDNCWYFALDRGEIRKGGKRRTVEGGGVQTLEVAGAFMLGRKAKTCSNYSPHALWFQIGKLSCKVPGGLGRSGSVLFGFLNLQQKVSAQTFS